MKAGPFRIVATPPNGAPRVIQRHTNAAARDAAFARLSRGKGWTYATEDAKPCRCNCGYVCMAHGTRSCGLPIMECIEKHYRADCEHDWTGPWWESPDGLQISRTCAGCGGLALDHDLRCGP